MADNVTTESLDWRKDMTFESVDAPFDHDQLRLRVAAQDAGDERVHVRVKLEQVLRADVEVIADTVASYSRLSIAGDEDQIEFTNESVG